MIKALNATMQPMKFMASSWSRRAREGLKGLKPRFPEVHTSAWPNSGGRRSLAAALTQRRPARTSLSKNLSMTLSQMH